MESKSLFHEYATDTRVSGTYVLLMNFVHGLFPYDVGIMNIGLQVEALDGLKYAFLRLHAHFVSISLI